MESVICGSGTRCFTRRNMSLPGISPIAGIVAVALVFTCAGWYANDLHHRANDRNKPIRIFQKGFRYTSPLLDVELPQGVRIGHEPIPFKFKVDEFVRKQKQTGMVHAVAVYYRDLADGPWFGIDESVEFNPASMMKVPLMIAWLRRAEKDARILQEKLVFDGKEDMNADESIKPSRAIVPGKPYSVDELLNFMLSYSDNNATTVLFKAMNGKELDEVIDGMNIDNHINDSGNSISLHDYSGFYRILYNSSYLSREMSEKALELLTREDFPIGIAAGVPAGTPVAAKFGEFTHGQSGSHRELHEVGIVYHPRQPYILGIMTRGSSTENQAACIREISRIIYSEVDANSNRIYSH